ncbi:hypothetical protein [Brevundimonas sp. FT23028]|uniref:hypothetical protein n=1 Tax=Brevundimonas sp. FT23028 TaxID=3393748 RepID=UPI003B589A60
MIVVVILLSSFAISGFLALFPSTRVLAVYLASIAACGAGLACTVAAVALFVGWVTYPYSGEGGDGLGLAMGFWGIGGLGLGGLVGIGAGIALAHRLTRGRDLF